MISSLKFETLKGPTLYTTYNEEVCLPCLCTSCEICVFFFIDIFYFVPLKNYLLILIMVPYVSIWYRFELNWSIILKCIFGKSSLCMYMYFQLVMRVFFSSIPKVYFLVLITYKWSKLGLWFDLVRVYNETKCRPSEFGFGYTWKVSYPRAYQMSREHFLVHCKRICDRITAGKSEIHRSIRSLYNKSDLICW